MTSLWNLIRDWFVQYIWGGCSSERVYYYNNFVGSFVDKESNYSELSATDVYLPISVYDSSNDLNMSFISMGDWLSTTSTIIVLVLLLVAFGFLIIGIFRLFSRMFALRS